MMMQEDATNTICQIVESMARAVLGADAWRVETATEIGRYHWFVGCVTVTGGWNGAVTMTCTKTFARRAASSMFGLEDEDVTDDDMRDAVGELTNILGGNYKACVSVAGSGLSLPVVVEPPLRVPGTATTSVVWFAIGEELVCVGILERPSGHPTWGGLS
ncbi:MAG: chemotaxis protein CheX [Polyangiaceae bacterium]